MAPPIYSGKTMQLFTHKYIYLILGITAADMTVHAHRKGQMISNPAVKYVPCMKPKIYKYD